MPVPMIVPSYTSSPESSKQEAHRVVAAPAAAEPLEAGLGARAAVVGRAGDQPLGVAAEIAGEAQAAPVAAAVREIVELVGVFAAAVEDHADAAVGHLPDAGADALAPALVAGRFGIGIAPHAAAVIMVVAGHVVQQAEAQRAAEALCPHGGVIVVVAAAADEDADAAEGLALHAADAAVAVVAAVVDQDAHAGQGRALGDVLGLVGVVAAEVHEHRDAQDGAALNARPACRGRRCCRRD